MVFVKLNNLSLQKEWGAIVREGAIFGGNTVTKNNGYYQTARTMATEIYAISTG